MVADLLAADPDIMTKSGQVLVVDDLAAAYGLVDLDNPWRVSPPGGRG